MRLIDADALEQSLTEKGDDYKVSMFATSNECNIARIVAFECAEEVKNAPTIEAEPVRHGKWVLCEGFMICCECGASPADWEAKPNNPLGLPPFCHSCGLKMDLEE